MRRLLLAVWLLAALPARAEDAASRFFVLGINGGGDKLDNFSSHLAHLRQLVDLAAASGIPKDHVILLASDGADPAPDLAVREPEPEAAWVLQGTRLEYLLRDLTRFESSALKGAELLPATMASLTRTVAQLRGRLRPGDTLLIYVTDHGTQSLRDPLDSRITLWGARESISVRKLGSLLRTLPSSVRVVSLMSQCYSGGFAYLHETRERKVTPSGQTCGYFSSTPDRPAYGCYPEVRGEKGIGHSFEFFSALGRRRAFAAAHAEVTLSGQTPDIPLRSSDVYLAEQLARAAGSPEREDAFIDPWLRQALAEPSSDTRRMVEQIAVVYGLAAPSSVAELDRQARDLYGFLDEMDLDGKTWETALADFNRANLDAFVAAQPSWRPRLDERSLRKLDEAGRREIVIRLVAELAAYVTSDPSRLAEGNGLLSGLRATDEINYRTQVRAAALGRMRFLFTSAAGRLWSKSNPRVAKAALALATCEDVRLPLPASAQSRPEPAVLSKLSPLGEDRQDAAAARPGWLGITFVPVSRARRKALKLPDGAAQITSVLPSSPAKQAGLRSGDIVLGQPSRPFTHPNELRPLIASSNRAALSLEVLRAKARITVKANVGAAPSVGR